MLFIIVAFMLVHLFAPQLLGGAFRTLMRPLWVAEDSTETGLGVFFTSLRSKQSLVEHNQVLQDELERVESLRLRNQALLEENRVLRELWDNRQFENLVLANVLRRPPATPYDTLIVDTGGSASVREGNRVVVDGSIVIGTVDRVDQRTALITLLSAPGVLTEVFIGTSTASVTARGRGGGNFAIEVPRELGVHVGEIVSLLGSRAFPIGKIESVLSTPTHPFELIYFQLPFNINALRFVEIITDNDEQPGNLVVDLEDEVVDGS